MVRERLQKILSHAGITSRRKAEELIRAGRVSVNGRVIHELGTRADAAHDHIKIDGKLLTQRTPKQYYIACKPQRMITSLSDPQGRPTITDLLRASRIRSKVYPVGRLDWDSEGLLLLTNDGELAHRVMHPRTHLPKVYRIKVKGHPSEEALQRVRGGMFIEHGVRTLPAQVILEGTGTGHTWYRVTLVEGRQHQLKKMFEHIGHPVHYIKRIAIGPLFLGSLRKGEVRSLTHGEIVRLKKSLGMDTVRT